MPDGLDGTHHTRGPGEGSGVKLSLPHTSQGAALPARRLAASAWAQPLRAGVCVRVCVCVTSSSRVKESGGWWPTPPQP